MPILEDQAYGAEDKDVAHEDYLSYGDSRSFVDNDPQNFCAVEASAITYDQPDSYAEDCSANNNDFERFPVEFDGEEMLNDRHGYSEGDGGEEHVPEESFADVVVGQEEEGDIEDDEGDRQVFFA